MGSETEDRMALQLGKGSGWLKRDDSKWGLYYIIGEFAIEQHWLLLGLGNEEVFSF